MSHGDRLRLGSESVDEAKTHGYPKSCSWSKLSTKKSKRKNEKTMVGFGRTEKSLSLSCTEFRALSHGHGFRGPCFNGVRKSWVFHDFGTVVLTVFDGFHETV